MENYNKKNTEKTLVTMSSHNINKHKPRTISVRPRFFIRLLAITLGGLNEIFQMSPGAEALEGNYRY